MRGTTTAAAVAGNPGNCGRIGRALILVCVIAGCGVTLSACHRAPRGSEPLRVSIYGVDGADWKVIDPLLASGELPHLAALIRDGVRAPFQSILPLASPPVWTTIATGVERAKHGVEQFITQGVPAVLRPGGFLVSSRDRKVPALWTIASQYHVSTAVLGWWATYPAEKIDGVMVSERAFKTREKDLRMLFGGSKTVKTDLVYPPAALQRVADLIVSGPEKSAGEKLDTIIEAMRSEDGAIARSLIRLRDDYHPRLEMILMRGVDVTSHHFWKFHEPDAAVYSEDERPSAAEVARYGEAVRNHYRYVDGLIGELLAGRTAADVTLVVSDHGFEAGRQPFRRGKEQLSGTHKSESASRGIFIAAGGPFRRNVRLDSVSILDVAPTVLHLLGLPVAETLSSTPRLDALEPEWVAAHPVRHVASYPGPAVVLSDETASRDSLVDDAVREQLRSLGYLK